MKQAVLVILSLQIVLFGFSQQNNNNKNSFRFSLGLSHRITPVEFKMQPGFFTVPVLYDRDRQINGLTLNFGLAYEMSKPKLLFELSNSLKQVLLYIANEPLGIYDKRVLATDYHFNVSKIIPNKKKNWKMGIGYSFLNNGTDYAFLNPDSTISYDNFTFSSFNVNLGIEVTQLSFELVNRFTMGHNYYNRGELYIPEIRIMYNLKIKNKKT